MSSSKATQPPMCKICGTAHWSSQKHDPSGLKAATKNHKPVPQKPAQRFTGNSRKR